MPSVQSNSRNVLRSDRNTLALKARPRDAHIIVHQVFFTDGLRVGIEKGWDALGAIEFEKRVAVRSEYPRAESASARCAHHSPPGILHGRLAGRDRERLGCPRCNRIRETCCGQIGIPSR